MRNVCVHEIQECAKSFRAVWIFLGKLPEQQRPVKWLKKSARVSCTFTMALAMLCMKKQKIFMNVFSIF